LSNCTFLGNYSSTTFIASGHGTLRIAVTNITKFKEHFLCNFDDDDHSFCLIYCTFKCKQ